MAPFQVISWERAVVLSYLGKVEVLEEYDESISSVSFTLRTPAVVRLTKARVPTQNKVRFSRTNVFLRDGFRCQYCGEKRPPRASSTTTTCCRVFAAARRRGRTS
jgi:5-methylcytosine-specific restriction endonuclease McrA